MVKKLSFFQTIRNELQKFKSACIQDAVDSIVVFFGSHGYKDHLMTSDGDLLDVQADIIYKLQFGKAELGKPVAKIFIDQTCRIDPPQGTFPVSPPQLPNCEDTIHIQAQMPKYEASRDRDCGSYFVIVLVYVLMSKACNTSLQSMLEEVTTWTLSETILKTVLGEFDLLIIINILLCAF